MPEHLRALIVIVFLASLGFSFARKYASMGVEVALFPKWRLLWFTATLAAFLSHNYWVFLIITAIAASLLCKDGWQKLTVFVILITALPPVGDKVPGFGLINYLIELDYQRFICITLLLPAAFWVSRGNKFRLGKTTTDKFALLYLILLAVLEFRDAESGTDALRRCFYIFTDFFLPYYVVSRGVKNITQMNTILYALICSAMVVAFIALFESVKHWLLYNVLVSALHIPDSAGGYLGRSGGLRAVASLKHPIVLGYFMVIAFGFYLYYQELLAKKNLRLLGLCLLGLGVFVPLSRGPWMGAAVVLVLFILQGRAAMKKLAMLALAGLVALPILAVLPGGHRIIELIPFVAESNTEQGNIEYRERLFTNSMRVINRHPLLGSGNYLDTAEMQDMVQGEQIVDIVNSYLRIGLDSGYIGLTLFLLIFLSALMALRKRKKQLKDKTQLAYTLARALIAVLAGIMAMIATTSSVGVIPILYWMALGLAIAFCRLVDTGEFKVVTNNAPAARPASPR